METAPAWEDCERTPRPPLTGDITVDVCVVGLGASGLAALHEARALGVSAVGIDAGVIAGGAAGRNAGFALAGLAAFHHDVAHPKAAALYRMTLDELLRTERLPIGSIRHPADDAERADCDAQHAAMVADGLPVEQLTDGSLLFPHDGVFHPVARCLALGRDLDAVHEHTPALDITGTAVRTPRATVACDRVVVAVDGNLERVLPELKERVHTARAQMLATGPATDVTIAHAVYSRWGYDYWHQQPDGRIFLGGCRDRFEHDEWGAPAVPTRPVQDTLERVLRDEIGTAAPVTHRWAGLIAFTDDRLPVLEEVRPGVWAAGGYSGTGNIVGVLNARAALRRAIGEPSGWADLLEH